MGTSQGFEEDKAGPPRPKVISCGLVAQRAKLFEQKIERNRILKEEIKSGTSRYLELQTIFLRVDNCN